MAASAICSWNATESDCAVEGVGDGLLVCLGCHQFQCFAPHAQLRAGQDECEQWYERRAVQLLFRVLGCVVSLDGRGHGDDSVRGDEHIVGDQAVRPGGLHAGDEPGLVEVEVLPRDECEALVDHRTALVGDGDAQHRPVRVPGAGVVEPAPGDPEAPVDLDGLRGWREDAGDLGVRVGAPDVILGLFGIQTGHPGAHVAQRDDPGCTPVGLGYRSGDVQHGAHRSLIAAVALWLGDLEDTGLGKRLDAVLDDPSVVLSLRGILREERL